MGSTANADGPAGMERLGHDRVRNAIYDKGLVSSGCEDDVVRRVDRQRPRRAGRRHIAYDLQSLWVHKIESLFRLNPRHRRARSESQRSGSLWADSPQWGLWC